MKNKETYRNIFTEIKKVIKTFDDNKIEHRNVLKYYRNISNLNGLIKDIKGIESEKFDDKKEYRELVKDILKDVIDDWKASNKDKIKEGMITKFDEFVNEEISRKQMGWIGGGLLGLGVLGSGLGTYTNKLQDDKMKSFSQTVLALPNKFELKERMIALGHDFVISSNDTIFGKIEQKILSWGTQFIYTNNLGDLQGRAEQRIIAFGNTIDIFDENGGLIGTVDEKIFESMFKVYTLYTIKDASGNVIANSEKIDILSTTIEISDSDGNLIAILKRPMFNLVTDTWSIEVKKDIIDKRLYLFMGAYKTKEDADRESESNDKNNSK